MHLSILLPTQYAKKLTFTYEEEFKNLDSLEEGFVLYEPLLYGCDWTILEVDYSVWSKMFYNNNTKVLDTANASKIMCDQISLFNVHRLFYVLMALPVSTA